MQLNYLTYLYSNIMINKCLLSIYIQLNGVKIDNKRKEIESGKQNIEARKGEGGKMYWS